MARQAQFLLSLLLALLLVDFGYSNPVNVNNHIDEETDLENVVRTANVNKMFDAFLPTLRRAIIELGMEPLKLMDYSESLLPLPGKLKGNIDFTDGWMQELSKIRRTTDVTASYINKRLVLDMNLGFDLLDFNYKYVFTYLLVKRTGDMYGRFHNADVRAMVTVDLENYRMQLDSIKFTYVKKFDLKFEGRVLDPLLNIVSKIITRTFKRHVLSVVEDRGLIIFGQVFEDLNKMIPVPDRIANERNAY